MEIGRERIEGKERKGKEYFVVIGDGFASSTLPPALFSSSLFMVCGLWFVVCCSFCVVMRCASIDVFTKVFALSHFMSSHLISSHHEHEHEHEHE